MRKNACYICGVSRTELLCTESNMWLCVSCIEEHFSEESLAEFIKKAEDACKKAEDKKVEVSCTAENSKIEEKEVVGYVPYTGDEAYMNML